MKTKLFILLLALFVVTTTVSAQTRISCSSFETCLLDENFEEVGCVETEEPCLFTFSEAETIITHTTDVDKTTYYVTKREVDDTMITYTTTSDTGENFLFIVMVDGSEVLMFFTDGDDNFMIAFTVKAVF